MGDSFVILANLKNGGFHWSDSGQTWGHVAPIFITVPWGLLPVIGGYINVDNGVGSLGNNAQYFVTPIRGHHSMTEYVQSLSIMTRLITLIWLRPNEANLACLF